MELINKSVIEINHTDFVPVLEPIFSHEIGEELGTDLLLILNKYKRTIDKIHNIKKWDFYKKMSNPFELINKYIKAKNLNLGLANYNPISRAFFKFWEILFDFNLIDNSNTSMVYAALAEGPGGFIEALSYFRKNESDTYYGMTLMNNSNDVPKWKKNEIYLSIHKNIVLEYGKDKTGNLYSKENLLYIYDKYKHSMNFITGDGGFDYSLNFNYQEV